MKTWAELLRQHATVHYNEDGWDILVECWTDEYIHEITQCAKTYEEAVVIASDVLSVMDGFRKDIQAEIY